MAHSYYIILFLTDGDSGAQKSSTKKTLTWAVPVGVVFVILLVALGFFMVKSRRLHRSFYHLVRSDSFDHGVTYHKAGKKTS